MSDGRREQAPVPAGDPRHRAGLCAGGSQARLRRASGAMVQRLSAAPDRGSANPPAAIEQYLNLRAVERLVAEHSIGRRDHSVVLWRLIVLNYWLAAFADGRLGRPPLAPLADITGTRARAARGATV